MTTFLKSGIFASAALALAAGPLASTAHAAETEATALGQCFTLSTNGKDRVLAARWILGALASASQLADMVKVDAEQKRQSDIGMAALFTRLLTVDCLDEAKAVFRGKQSQADVGKASEVLGQIAVQELFGNSRSVAEFGTFSQYLNESDFDVLKN